jgi:hypothetical protein
VSACPTMDAIAALRRNRRDPAAVSHGENPLGVLSFDPVAIEACFLEQCRGVQVGLVDNEVAVSPVRKLAAFAPPNTYALAGVSSSVVGVEPTPRYLTRPIIGSMV